MKLHTEKIAKISLMVTLGILLGYLENLINIIPLSGVKIGLSNLIVIYALYKMNLSDCFIVITIKSILNGILFSSLMSIFYSIPAGFLSVLVMFLLKNKLNVNIISVYGISMAGSCVFNIAQFVVAALILSSPVILVNLWYVLPISLVTGYFMAEIFKIIFLKDKDK